LHWAGLDLYRAQTGRYDGSFTVHLHPKSFAAASYRLRPSILEVLLRKLLWFAAVCSLFLFANLASAQQADAMIGFGTIVSPGAASCNLTSGCPEKGGLYPSVSADVIFHRRIGFAYEVTWRGGQGLYGGSGSAPYRPIIQDFNAVFQPRVSKKVGLDLMAGIGWQDTRLYTANYTCTFFSCTNYSSSNHFLVDVGGGIRYYFWHHAFIRPEVKYYNVHNNVGNLSLGSFGFSSSSIVRVGASIGYTIGPE